MPVRIVHIAILSVLFAVCAAPLANAGEGKGHGGPVAFILKHAADLNLTDDQKTQLEALAKEVQASLKAGETPTKENREAVGAKVKAILTPEQQEKLKALRESGKGKGKPDTTPGTTPATTPAATPVPAN
jgi:Spy/CpxP family protein refolding chaperone